MQKTYAQPAWGVGTNRQRGMETLFVKQFVDPGLGNSSYLIASKETGAAVVIDPQRDVDKYLQTAEGLGLRLTHSLETHLHADFVSGSLELAHLLEQINLFQIGASARAELQYPHRPLSEGERLALGQLSIRVIETPGHTPEHVSYAVYDEGADAPGALFTGGSLIVGGAGRSDLLGEEYAVSLAEAQFHSLHDKLLKLPDEVVVYPTHGAGSFCITPAGKERVTTIGQERRTNPLVQIDTKQEFVKRALMGLSTYPTYYRHMRRLNREARSVLDGVPALTALDPYEFQKRSQQGAVIIDVRPAREFIARHIPNSYGIPLATPLASWAGWVVPFGSPIILVADLFDEVEEATRQLIRIGYDDLRGYLAGGLEYWEKADLPIFSWHQVSASRLRQWLRRDSDSPFLLDVRQNNEWLQGHIEGARHVEAGILSQVANTLVPRDRPVVVHCARGNRSTVALSILEQKGFQNLFALEDGIASWSQAGYEIVQGEQ